MRKPVLLSLSLTLACMLVFAACGSSSKSGAGKAPVAMSGKVTNKGTKDVSAQAAPKIEIEAYDFDFRPTFIKAKPGSTVTVELKNEGKVEHTFTIDGQSIDQDLQPDAKAEVQVTIPQSGALEFHCRFHGSQGMRGAFYTAAGAKVQNAATDSSGSGSDSRYGY